MHEEIDDCDKCNQPVVLAVDRYFMSKGVLLCDDCRDPKLNCVNHWSL